MKKLYGVITAMTTPFTADNKVDVAALEAQTEYLIQKGVQCLYPCGTTGEMYLMSAEERELVAETVVKKAAGRVTVFIHVGAMDQDETIRLAQHAQKIGADGVGVVTPSYFTVDEKAMVEYYKTVCAALLQVRGGNFSVVPGADDLFLPCLACGCDGVVSGCSGPFPEAFVNVYKAFQSGDLAAARKAQVEATKLVKVMQFGGDMSIFKNILTFRGVPGGHMRKPLMDLNEAGVAKLKETVAPYL